nr:hypothetical protein [uncultured bacterium]
MLFGLAFSRLECVAFSPVPSASSPDERVEGSHFALTEPTGSHWHLFFLGLKS